ncbi:rod shape-determining protein MreC [Nonlabens ulvanivorans]|uniref:Cell shape-determining protein MreC n=1 Tax=Nonlabens ulvanivorans TaxID=906888 RepID=A0A084JSV2_NONUL|nr:rod shape-determining protein MreC [Nonlabens ulvanivorans]KEZ92036.1 rod shape-determining protein [Nonlabens ulvanivorans]PRX14864.1 rod shape-determining protein MreC [Nonlabens ulvanivorans]
MQQIINFLIKYRNLLLYLSLLLIALVFTVQSHSYHRNSFVHSTGNITGSFLSSRSGIYDYLNLKEENDKLRKENAMLRMKALVTADTLLGDETTFLFSEDVPYRVFPSRVIKNDYSKRDNFITLDIGIDQGIEPDMGVVTTNGILGIIDISSNRFSRVISILNSEISLNAQIKGSNVIGSLTWDGNDPYMMSLVDVPRLAKVTKGDTIVTGRQSTTFPPDILIGTIRDAQLVENGSRYKIDVALFNDMTDIGTAYVIKSRDVKPLQIIDTLTTNVNE